MQKGSLLAIIGLSASLFLIGCADDQARAQLADTNYRLAQLQKNVGLLDTKVDNQKLIDMINQLDSLQSQINQLNGSLEALRYNVKESQSVQEQLNQSFDARLQALDGTSSVSTTTTKPTPEATATTPHQAIGNSNELQHALVTLKAKDYPKAITQFKNIIATNPNKENIANASYYLGIAYAANGQYKQAITTASKFYQDNPNNKNAPDAMRTIFICQNQMGNSAAAKAMADKLQKMYPKSAASKKVQSELR